MYTKNDTRIKNVLIVCNDIHLIPHLLYTSTSELHTMCHACNCLINDSQVIEFSNF